jgi:hypothetical protein
MWPPAHSRHDSIILLQRAELKMSLLSQGRDAPAIAAPAPSEMRSTANAKSHAAMIKRFCACAGTMAAFVLVVTGLVVLKSIVWIPHFTP